MLARNSYSAEFIATARTNVDAQVADYRRMAESVGPRSADYLAAFEPTFFTNLLLMLDGHFTHRTRALEGKDGNALNEVRILCASITGNGRRMLADSTIKLDPATSIMGYRVGDEIRVTEKDFLRLSAAYFAELEKRYSETG
jgi:hypothetical protein